MGLISEAIQRHIASTREVREGPQPYWYPSQMGGCERQAVLKRAGVRGADFDDRTLRVFWMGDEVHSGLQKAVASGLPDGYSLVGHELRVRDADYHVSGRLDSLVRRPDGELEVIEFKSTRTKAFGYGDLPKPEHVLQLGVYGTFPASCECKAMQTTIHELGHATLFDAGATVVHAECNSTGLKPLPNYGKIVYWSKDDAAIMEFDIKITDELRENVKKKLVHLDEQYAIFKDTGDLPAPLPDIPILTADGTPQIYKIGPKKGQPFVKQDWRITYCPYLGTGQCCGDVKNG